MKTTRPDETVNNKLYGAVKKIRNLVSFGTEFILSMVHVFTCQTQCLMALVHADQRNKAQGLCGGQGLGCVFAGSYEILDVPIFSILKFGFGRDGWFQLWIL